MLFVMISVILILNLQQKLFVMKVTFTIVLIKTYSDFVYNFIWLNKIVCLSSYYSWLDWFAYNIDLRPQ